MTTHQKKSSTTLPVSRIRAIMRSSPDVSSISPEAIALTAHSAELFISQLVKDAFNDSEDKTKLDYKDLSRVVASNERLAFLQDIIPKKMTVKDYNHMRAQMETQNRSDEKDGCSDEDKEFM